MIKICIGCKKALDASEFYPHRGHKFGRSSRCRSCTKIYNMQHHERVKNRAGFKERRRAYHSVWYKKNYHERRGGLNEKARAERRRCVEHYGGKCICCGETRYEFLAIDHIEGNGRQHRLSISGKTSRWLIKNNFPQGFRILCHNCNQSLGYNGYCPHDRERIAL